MRLQCLRPSKQVQDNAQGLAQELTTCGLETSTEETDPTAKLSGIRLGHRPMVKKVSFLRFSLVRSSTGKLDGMKPEY